MQHLCPANRLKNILGKSTKKKKIFFSEDQSGSPEFLRTCVTCLLSNLRNLLNCPWVSYLCHILGVSSLVNATTFPSKKGRNEDKHSGKNNFSIFLKAYFQTETNLSGAQLKIEPLTIIICNSHFSFFPETPNPCIKFL